MEKEFIEEEQEPDSIKTKLSQMTFADLQKLKAEIGTKVYNEALYGSKTTKIGNFQRENKHGPREVSSKFQKPQKQIKKQSNKSKPTIQPRDPRFDSLCGEYDDTIFKKHYSFVDKVRENEKQKLKEELKAETDKEERKKIKVLLSRMNNRYREDKKKEAKIAEKSRKREEKLRNVKEGKKIHFRSKFETKMANLIDQYNTLKKSGKLQKHIERQRKKNNSKSNKQVMS